VEGRDGQGPEEVSVVGAGAGAGSGAGGNLCRIGGKKLGLFFVLSCLAFAAMLM
jgi:hypothetical protein